MKDSREYYIANEGDFVVMFKHASNGLICKAVFINEFEQEEKVVVCEDTGHNYIDNIANCLYEMEEYLSPSNSKYSDKRIYIKVEPGSEHDVLTEDEKWLAMETLDKKTDNMSWEEYGKLVHKTFTEDIEKTNAFKKQKGYDGY